MRSRRSPLVERAAELLQRLRLERWTAIAFAASFLMALAIVLGTTQFRLFALRGAASAWIAGTVAENDFVVERDFQYVDERATQLKRDAQERLVPPVFTLNALAGSSALATFDRFAQSLQRQVKQGLSEEKILVRLQALPGAGR